MKNIIKYIEEALLSKNNKTTINNVNSDGYFDDPPMTVDQAVQKTCKHFYGKLCQEYHSKMDQWHNGTRKENVKNCSDAKLIAYYVICNEYEYLEEMEKLEDEANRRGWSLKKLKDVSFNY